MQDEDRGLFCIIYTGSVKKGEVLAGGRDELIVKNCFIHAYLPPAKKVWSIMKGKLLINPTIIIRMFVNTSVHSSPNTHMKKL